MFHDCRLHPVSNGVPLASGVWFFLHWAVRNITRWSGLRHSVHEILSSKIQFCHTMIIYFSNFFYNHKLHIYFVKTTKYKFSHPDKLRQDIFWRSWMLLFTQADVSLGLWYKLSRVRLLLLSCVWCNYCVPKDTNISHGKLFCDYDGTWSTNQLSRYWIFPPPSLQQLDYGNVETNQWIRWVIDNSTSTCYFHLIKNPNIILITIQEIYNT